MIHPIKLLILKTYNGVGSNDSLKRGGKFDLSDYIQLMAFCYLSLSYTVGEVLPTRSR